MYGLIIDPHNNLLPVGLINSSTGRALYQHHRGQGLIIPIPAWIFQAFLAATWAALKCDDEIHSFQSENFLHYHHLLYKHQWNTKWAFMQRLHIFTCEDNMLSSHMKRSPSLWLHHKLHLWKQADLVFHWCLYNKQNIAYLIMDMTFIFSCSTRYLTRSLCSLMRYWVDHSKIKFISARRHVNYILYLSLTIDPDTTTFSQLVW